MPATKVLIIEDEPAISQDIKLILLSQSYDVVGIADSANKAFDMLASRAPDIVLLDISIKGDHTGIDIAAVINHRFKIPFVFLTSYSDSNTLDQVKKTKPYGYIVKPFKDSDLAPAIEVALLRKSSEQKTYPTIEELNKVSLSPLTQMEYQISRLIWEGNKNQQMADALFLSINTIKTHIGNLYVKTAVNSKSALISKIREST